MSGLREDALNPYSDPTSRRAYALIFNGLTAALTEWMPLSERSRLSRAVYDSLRGGDLEVRFADGLEMLRLADLALAEQTYIQSNGEGERRP